MTKRKTMACGVHEDVVLAKKHRKKSQAFGVPKTAAVKAIIKRNATESTLLRLPLEVRRRIWAFALGDRLLHIQQFDSWGFGLDGSRDGDADRDEQKWLATCCISPYTETELFERSKQDVEELIDKDEAELGLFLDRSCTAVYDNECTPDERRKLRRHDIEEEPHSSCREFAFSYQIDADIRLEDDPYIASAEDHFLPVQLLRVCRQIYTEASPILWTTNTFSFKDAEDYEGFMLERTSAQKAVLAKLRFDINLIQGNLRRVWEVHACNLSLIRSLRGLRSLSLHVDQGFRGVTKIVGMPNLKLMPCFEGIQKYKILPLQSVSVVIADHRDVSNQDKLTFSDRITMAEEIRKILLDPEGAQKFDDEHRTRLRQKPYQALISGA